MRKPPWILASLVLLLGCQTTDGTSGSDARVWEPTDASVWQPLVIDGGPAADAGACDLGLPPISAMLLPVCDGASRECLLGCGGEQMCEQGCYAANTIPEPAPNFGCSNCITLQALACADVNGCRPAISAFVCCSAANCGEGTAEDCAATVCGAELSAMFTCLQNTPTCLDYYDPAYIGACFADAPPMVDAGPMDTDAGMPADGGM